MIQIDKDVPIPLSVTEAKYPFIQMDVGDSFAVPLNQRHAARQARFWAQQKYTDKHFISRTIGETCRFWRVK